MMELKKLQQTTMDSCMSTCVSMVTGINLKTVMRDLHNDYITCKEHSVNVVIRYLFECGFDPLTDGDMGFKHEFNDNYIYVVGLPSLQAEGQTHAVVLYFDDDGFMRIADPMYGHSLGWYCFGQYGQDNGSFDMSDLDINIDFAIKINHRI